MTNDMETRMISVILPCGAWYAQPGRKELFDPGSVMSKAGKFHSEPNMNLIR